MNIPSVINKRLLAMSRRRFARTVAGTTILGSAFGLPSALLAKPRRSSEPVPIPGGTPLLGGSLHVFAPGPDFDPLDAEPSTITDFNGFIGLAYISGMVTRTNTVTGEQQRLPFLNSDMRFMEGIYRGTDGRIHQGAFGFV